MGLFKQLMIFGKTGLQGLPTRVALSLWAFSRQGVTGSPYSQHGILCQVRGEPQYLETFRAGADPGSILSHLGLGPPRDRDRVLYGMELGSVTLKRIGFFCFPIKHSTHTWGGWTWAIQRWILGRGLRVGGPGTPPSWRTREELCTVRNSAR